MQDIISNGLNCMMNVKRAGKDTCVVPSSKIFLGILAIMKKGSYVLDYKEDNGKVEIKIGNLNNCRAIKPRFYVKKDQFDKYVRRFLPARNFGTVIVSTSKGMMMHEEAIEKNIGGSLIAFCY